MTDKPRTRRHQRTKQAILDAALEIINESGPADLSMRALADRIDYSPAGLYEYFSGKEEIVQAICQQGHEHLTAYMSQVERTLPSEEYLLEIGLAYIRFALDYADHFLLMFSTPPPATTEMPPVKMMADNSSFGILVAGIQRGIAEGVLHSRPGFGWLEMAYAAWATVHGLAMLRITSMRSVNFDFDAADRLTLRNFHRGLVGA